MPVGMAEPMRFHNGSDQAHFCFQTFIEQFLRIGEGRCLASEVHEWHGLAQQLALFDRLEFDQFVERRVVAPVGFLESSDCLVRQLVL